MGKKLKKRRKPSGRNTAKKLLEFRNKVDELKYQKMSKAEILEEILEEDLKMPRRATPENALQDQYKYISSTKYAGKINTGMIGDRYTEKGSCWVSLIDTETKKVVLRREFYHTLKGSPLDRISPYAHLVKNIADSRPALSNLVEINETEYGWKSKNGKRITPINLADYMYDMNQEDKDFLITNEKNRDSYLKRTAGLVTRQRTFQKKWK